MNTQVVSADGAISIPASASADNKSGDKPSNKTDQTTDEPFVSARRLT
ncbi:MAG TPA: hypothetical protein VIC26_07225 [Marinagarivorans sp.]